MNFADYLSSSVIINEGMWLCKPCNDKILRKYVQGSILEHFRTIHGGIGIQKG